MILYEYPQQAKLERFLPKSKVFEFVKPGGKLKELFVQQIEKITVAYSLSHKSLNLSATDDVKEIQIMRIQLKTTELSHEILRSLDKAIRSPLIFELHYSNQQKVIAAFKRPSDADPAKWVINDYFETDWLDINTPRTSLPIALDLSGLYEKLLEPLMPHKSQDNENLQARVTRMDLIHVKERELEKAQARLRKEKQFNRKVTINAELRRLNQEIQQLTHSSPVDEH